MKRRFFTPLLVVISLLTSCNDRTLRSDIKEFIASFSISEARSHYLESGYVEEITSVNQTTTTRVREEFNFNIKDLENITYSHTYVRYDNDELIESHDRRVIKKEEQYYLVYDEQESEITSQNIISLYITMFFYRSSLEEYYSIGMYIGDTIKTIIYDMQDFVTIDNEANTFTYDIPFGVQKDQAGYDFEEILVVDQYGMVKSCNIRQTNTIVELTKSITVYNVVDY